MPTFDVTISATYRIDAKSVTEAESTAQEIVAQVREVDDNNHFIDSYATKIERL